jgi:hypothetical protein
MHRDGVWRETIIGQIYCHIDYQKDFLRTLSFAKVQFCQRVRPFVPDRSLSLVQGRGLLLWTWQKVANCKFAKADDGRIMTAGVVLPAGWRGSCIGQCFRMFGTLRLFQQMAMDEGHHFEGYCRADGECFDGGYAPCALYLITTQVSQNDWNM